MEDVSTLVGRMYDALPYPPPTFDLDEAIAAGGFQIGDPKFWASMLWPEGPPNENPTILVAGCGTTQAAWLAHTNPGSEVIGVDLSEASLAHARYLQDKHALGNLRLFKGDLRDVGNIGIHFDLVICTGVLHHMADPDEGMRALASVMQPQASLACMVYGATYRAGVYMMQDVFRRLNVKPNKDGVAFVRHALTSVPEWHPVHRYLMETRELQHDAAIADTFLHPQDRAYLVPQVLALVEDNGLHFQGWFENSGYYPEGRPWLPAALSLRVAHLPAREQWAATEMLNPSIPTHFFFARKSSPPEIAFDRPGTLAPQQRPGLRRKGLNAYARAGRTFELPPEEAALFEQADGSRTIAQLGDTTRLFERLWKQGHVMMLVR